MRRTGITRDLDRNAHYGSQLRASESEGWGWGLMLFVSAQPAGDPDAGYV